MAKETISDAELQKLSDGITTGWYPKPRKESPKGKGKSKDSKDDANKPPGPLIQEIGSDGEEEDLNEQLDVAAKMPEFKRKVDAANLDDL